MILFNRGTTAADFTFSLSRDVGLTSGVPAYVRDIAARQDYGVYKTDIVSFAGVAQHSVMMLLLTAKPQMVRPQKYQGLGELIR